MTKKDFLKELAKINYTQARFHNELKRKSRITDRLKDDEEIPYIYVRVLELIQENIKKEEKINQLLEILKNKF